MGGLDVVFGEVAKQRTGYPPLCVSLPFGLYRAEVGVCVAAKGHHLVGSVEAAARQLEVDCQSFLVVNYLRLLCYYAQVCGVSVAHVVDEQCKLSLFARLDGFCQRVVTVNVALHEVCQLEVGGGVHRQRYGVNLACCGKSVVWICIRQRAAEHVVGGFRRRRVLGGDIQYCCLSGGSGCQFPSGPELGLAVEAVDRL